MSDTNDTILDAIRRRSAQRRDVLKYAGQATAVAGGLTLLSACNEGDYTFGPLGSASPTPSPTSSSKPSPTPSPSPAPTATPALAAADIKYFQFLLNIEYLRTSFFLEASNYGTLGLADTSGDAKFGTAGTVTLTKVAPPDYSAGVVVYKTNLISSYAPAFATEMANVGVSLVRQLRTLLGSSSVAIPQIDLEGARSDSTGAWYTLATKSGVTSVGGSFNPAGLVGSYLSASIFLNSVALAAYRGVVPLVTPAGAAILGGFIGTISYYTALQRMAANLEVAGDTTKGSLSNPQKFSDYVDTLDGTKTDLDQGPGPGADTGTPSNSAAALNVVASDANGLALARSPAQTLNVLYLNPAAAASGGFFPAGVNGDASLKTSADTSTL